MRKVSNNQVRMAVDALKCPTNFVQIYSQSASQMQ
jgi:hypothetical protein